MRLVYLQIFQNEYWQQQAANARTRETPIIAERGDIYDRNGNILAISISSDSVYVNPNEIKKAKIDDAKKAEMATFLSNLLELEYEGVMKKLEADSTFIWLKRKIDFDISSQIEAADYVGIEIMEEPRRYYPKGTLMAQVLGFAGVDNQGLEGIERAYDDILKGVDGTILTEYDARSNEVPQAVHKLVDAQDGQGLVLTLDENIQYFCERAIADIMAWEEPPTAASILVMGTKTGEILAMAMSGAGDPNEFGSYGSSGFRNRLVTDSYEPGSTFKMFTTAIALEEGVVNENSTFYDPGYIMVGDNKIKCWRHYKPHGEQKLLDTLKNSCNPAFVEMGFMIDAKEKGLFYKYITAFGFGSSTNIGLSGESSGIMIAEKNVTKLDLATMSFGQSVSVTPLQMVSAASAIANGGTLLQPQIIKQILDADGNVIQDFGIKTVRQVISESTSRKMCEFLEEVVANGTGRSAYVEGYRVAGKTGTAQKAGAGGYQEGKYVASFCGFAPANDPEITVLVLIDEPSGALYQGGQVAAPVAQIIFSEVLRYLGVTAQTSEESICADIDLTTFVDVPDLRNLSYEDAAQVLKLYGLTAKKQGSGTRVVAQSYSANEKLMIGTEVILTMGTGSDSLFVPDLTGFSLGEATNILSAYGLKLKSSGSGYVHEQIPQPSTEVTKGKLIELILSEEDETDADMNVVAP
ncbi:MAG: PASTA domain-containing protein [Firmicutes bacterium]|nr:PASTA domain-containing protein [Bacillota bacterium]